MDKLNWKHCYVIQGHGKKIFAKTEEAIQKKVAYCLETITKLW